MRDLFQDIISSRARNPHNLLSDGEELKGRWGKGWGRNPNCGDEYTVYVHLDADGEAVAAVRFKGKGCAISKAATQLMAEAVEGLPLGEVAELAARYKKMIAGETDGSHPSLGRLAAFATVGQYPLRVKCAIMGWECFFFSLARACKTP